MINLCLDTNVYLSFYHYSDNTLQKLEAILTLISEKELKIILPEQIKNEFIRNREIKIVDALKKIKEAKIEFNLPRLLDSYPEQQEIRDLFKQYSEKRKELIEKVEKDINDKTLKADLLIQKIFKKAEFIILDNDIRDRAKKRYDLGNPPGKDKSYGDAVIWETLINYKDKKINIDFVSIDGDYVYPLDNDKLNNFLQQEREEKREGNILFYSSLNSFFEKYFPGIKINEEYFKNKYLEKFIESYSFDNARYNLDKIIKFENYSLEQIDKIIGGAIGNDQIWRSIEYSSWVAEELVKLVNPYLDKIDFSKVAKFLEIYNPRAYNEMRSEYEAESAPRDPDETYLIGEPF